MKNTREFEIAWMGLKPGIHEYQYDLGNAFFAEREAPKDVQEWAVTVRLRFDRQLSFFRLHFDVGGAVTVPCDRCGDTFALPLWDEFDLLVKLAGEEESGPDDDDADVAFIPRTETVLNVSDWLYEFTLLSLPLQRIHPDRPDGSPGCNPEALRLLGKLSEHHDEVDARWKGLEALKEKKPEEDNN